MTYNIRFDGVSLTRSFLAGMLVVFSLIAAIASLTGASSLTRCLSEALDRPELTSDLSKKEQEQVQRVAPQAGRAVKHADSLPLPASLSSQASLVSSLLDDAEISCE